MARARRSPPAATNEAGSVAAPAVTPAVRKKSKRQTRVGPRHVVGKLAAASLAIASAGSIGWSLNHPQAPVSLAAGQSELPNSAVTPGAVDETVDKTHLCQPIWRETTPGAPPAQGGNLTYSKAARHTSDTLKDGAFTAYGLQNPHDGGHSYEVDHLVPLSLGGRDVKENLWPQSRTLPGHNAGMKDRLELRLLNLVCAPKPGDPAISLRTAQDALRINWVAAFETYCGEEEDCPAYAPKTATD